MKSEKIILKVLSLFALLLFNLAWSGPASSAGPAIPRQETLGDILYVQAGAGGDCSSWDDACELNLALASAIAGDEIWVAGGNHFPGPAGNLLATFQLKDGVALYGGFAGDETARSERDWTANPTVLSGDLDRNGLVDAANAYHVVTGSGVGSSAILDGFTISGGNAGGDLNMNGGGLYASSGSPTLSNLTFSGNKAGHYGGAIYLYLSNPRLTQVSFTNNTAERGGGMYVYLSDPTLTRVSFSANSADQGGGMYNYVAREMKLTDLTFSANSASEGGGMLNAYSPHTLTNATFYANLAEKGAGIYNYYSPHTLTNATFHANNADTGGGIYNNFSEASLANVTLYVNSGELGGAIYNINGIFSLINAIVWGNTPYQNQLSGDLLSYSYTYSDIQVGTGYEGEGNMSQDPLLGELSDNGGFSLTHALLEGSPAIDTGDPLSCPEKDQRGMPRPADGDLDGQAVCDMGAYEFQPEIITPTLHLPMVIK